MNWKFDHATHIGGRAEQQDRVCVLHAARSDRHLLVVADGMGGHAAGAEAAQTVVEAAGTLFAGSSRRTDPNAFLTEFCASAHARVRALHNGLGRSPGSTFVALYLRGAEAHWAHVGDSRLYHFRSERAVSRTADHSLHELHGGEAPAHLPEAHGDRRRNGIYMRLGGDNDPIPDLGSSLALPGDLFLLCTDGYWGPVSETETARLVGSGPLPEDGAVRLVSAARRRGGRSGDNIGLAVAQCLPSAAKQRGLLTSLFSLFRLPGP